MKELNKLRLMAGLVIDPTIEITERKTPVNESKQLNERVNQDGSVDDFWVVTACMSPDATLHDCLHRTNTQGLIHMIVGASQNKGDLEGIKVYTGDAKHFAEKEAKRRLRAMKKEAAEAEEEMFFRKAEVEAEEDAEYEEATKLADQDYDGDGTIESPADEWKGSRDKAIKRAIRANQHEEEEWTEKDFEYVKGQVEPEEPEWKPDYADIDGDGDKKEPMKKAAKDKKLKEGQTIEYTAEGVESGTQYTIRTDRELEIGQLVRVGVDGEQAKITESMHTYKMNNYDSWEDDEEEPTNVAGDAKKSKGFPDDVQVKAGKDDPKSHDKPEYDKDESPHQLVARDNKSPQDQGPGHDEERPFTVPARIKKLLKDEAAQARREAEKLDVSDRNASYFYHDLANAYDDLHDHLDQGTVRGIKKAQIFMTSLMGPMLHKIPRDVVDFVAKGGEQRSLKDYMTKVDSKYPITGPRNELS